MCRLLVISRRQLAGAAQSRVGSGISGPLVCPAAAFPNASADLGLGTPLWRGLTLERGLPAVPAHPAKGAEGPKASKFGTGQGATSWEHASAWCWLCCICKGSL